MNLRRFPLFTLLPLLAVLTSCDQRPSVSPPEPIDTVHPLVNGYTTGLIPIDGAFSVQLNPDGIDLSQVRQLDLGELMTFKPSIQGKVILQHHTLSFTPDEHWDWEKKYECTLRLNQVHSSARALTIPLTIKSPAAEITSIYHDYGTLTGANQVFMKVRTKIEGLDQFEEKKPTVVINDLPEGVTIKWRNDRSKDHYQISIGPFTRKASTIKYTLEIPGDELPSKTTLTQDFDIPAEQHFSIVNTEVNQVNQAITISFSDPIKNNIELSGIVQATPTFAYKAHIDGHQLIIVPTQRLNGRYKLEVDARLRNARGRQLSGYKVVSTSMTGLKPTLKKAYTGSILPSSGALTMAFEAVNITGIRLRVVRVPQANVHQALQNATLADVQPAKSTGRLVLDKKLPLQSEQPIDFDSWTRYSIDLADHVEVEPGALYQVIIAMEPDMITYDCEEGEAALELPTIDPPINESDKSPFYVSYLPVRDWSKYRWEDRDNPCKPSFYMEQQSYIQQTLLASDIGLFAQQSDPRQLDVIALSIDQATPMSGVELTAYSYQHTVLGRGTTDSRGRAKMELNSDPFLLMASRAGQMSYLRLDDGQANNMSLFEVDGTSRKKGIHAYLYGDRGVWRPGDTLFIQSILRDEMNKLEPDFPIVIQWYDPKGQSYKREVQRVGDDVIHNWRIHIPEDAPTGRWRSELHIGSLTYTNTWRVETVQANRIKVDYRLPDKLPTDGSAIQGRLEAAWLHGTPAADLRATSDLLPYPDRSPFDSWASYSFMDETSTFKPIRQPWVKGQLDSEGRLSINKTLTIKNAPGPMKGQLTTQVYEPGGRFTTDRRQIKLQTYDDFVGIKCTKGTGWRGSYRRNDQKQANILLVDPNGKPIKGEVVVSTYHLHWEWWYHRRDHTLADFISNRHMMPVSVDTLTSAGDPVPYDLQQDDTHMSGWYVIVAKSKTSGHQATALYRMGWYSQGGAQEAAQLLQFTLDKDKYEVGDQINAQLPELTDGQLIVSIATGSDILSLETIEMDGGQRTLSYQADPAMAPNAYIHLTHIQPHAVTANDLPLRTYGVLPVEVHDPRSHLHPQLTISADWRPNSEVSISVKDSLSQACSYTIAIVDEGLLSLTGFKTPDPWRAFHERVALGVQTWDLYDDVIGAHAGEMTALLAMGGDGEVADTKDPKSNRFEPMVRFLGPFTLDAGDAHSHKVTLPNYVGEVRCMVIAASDRAYGQTDLSTKVTQPVMVQTALPRVLGPGDKVRVPVTIFAMKEEVKNVSITLETGDYLTLDRKTQEVSFDRPGEQVIYFDLEVDEAIGRSHIRVDAKAGRHSAYSSTDISIRAPNTRQYHQTTIRVAPETTIDTTYQLIGLEGDRHATALINPKITPLNGPHFHRLIRYPHGCLEQTISRAMPQLYLADFIDLSPEQAFAVNQYVDAAIDKLRLYRRPNGTFNYWPGGSRYHSWADINAGVFLIEAHHLGYNVPPNDLDNWLRAQGQVASQYKVEQTPSKKWLLDVQAYRLYALALGEVADIGAMNRLSDPSVGLSFEAQVLLAMAYELVGRHDRAVQLLRAAGTPPDKLPDRYWHSFGSKVRQASIYLEGLWRIDNTEDAFERTENLVRMMESESWLSTQSTAFALRAIAIANSSSDTSAVQFAYRVGSKDWTQRQSTDGATSIDLPTSDVQRLMVRNEDKNRPIYVKVLTDGIPGPYEALPSQHQDRLSMAVQYVDADGQAVALDRLRRGEDLYVRITVQSKADRRLENLALTYMAPSGWEIYNDRLDASASQPVVKADYQDIRDDRVLTYFGLDDNEKRQFVHRVTPDFEGRYYLPHVHCEDMYDHTIQATDEGRWVEVVE